MVSWPHVSYSVWEESKDSMSGLWIFSFLNNLVKLSHGRGLEGAMQMGI
jgi:hypothetical protein